MSDIAFAIISTLIMVAMFVVMCWLFLSCYRFTEIIEGYLSDSKIVQHNRTVFESAGLIGMVIRNCSIALIFLIPKLCERRGLIEKDELSNLPVYLKRRLLAPWIAGGVLFFAMFVLWLFFV